MAKKYQQTPSHSDSEFASKLNDTLEQYPILSLIPDPAVVIDFTGNIKAANERGSTLFSQQVSSGLSLFSLIDKESEERLNMTIESSIPGTISVIDNIKGITRGKPPISATLHCLKENNHIIITAQVISYPQPEISDKSWKDGRNDKPSETAENTRNSESELRNMLEASPVAVCISEQQSGVLSFVNESISKLLGATKDELIGDTTLQFWKNPGARNTMLDEFKKTGHAAPREVEILRKNGESRWISLTWTQLLIDGDDRIVSWLHDISQIKEAEAQHKNSHDQLEKRVTKRTHELEREIADREKIEAALRESEAEFSASANSASDWFWGMDQNYKFNSFSERMEAITGIDQNELLGSPCWKVLRSDLTKKQWDQYKTELIDHKPFRDFKFGVMRKDSSVLPISISGIPIFDHRGYFKGYRGAGRDISQELIAEEEAKKLQQELHHSQKMEAIGQLTGGVAHDFNNILAIILGNLDLVFDDLRDDSPLYSFIKAIERSATKGAQLTQRLLAYSRKQELHPQKENLNILTGGIIELINRVLGEEIDIHYAPTEDLRPVFADPSQIENSLMNLCINSSDAMPKGGELFIETGNLTTTETDAQDYPFLKKGLYSWVSVRDTGSGMDGTTLQHVFEPFFTTKDVGKGTGLGLSMIYGFAKQSNGTVLIESEAGKGTMVTLILPSLKN